MWNCVPIREVKEEEDKKTKPNQVEEKSSDCQVFWTEPCGWRNMLCSKLVHSWTIRVVILFSRNDLASEISGAIPSEPTEERCPNRGNNN